MLPKTLGDVVGLGTEAAALRDAALVTIGCQNTYREGIMKLAGVEDALAEAQRLLGARSVGGYLVDTVGEFRRRV